MVGDADTELSPRQQRGGLRYWNNGGQLIVFNIQKQVNKFIIISAQVMWQLRRCDPEKALEMVNRKWMSNQQVYCSSYKTKRNWGERSRDWGSCLLKSYDPLPSVWTWARARVYKSGGLDPHVIPCYYITASVSAHIYCCIWGPQLTEEEKGPDLV